MLVLRDFLFLDTNRLENYLSTLEGYVEEEIDHSKLEKEAKRAKADAKILGGDIASERATELKSRRRTTPSSQFQRLYDLLQELDQLQHLDAFDNNIWETVERGEILEIQARLRLPSFLIQMEVIKEVTEFASTLPFITESLEGSLPGFSEVKRQIELRSVPLIFEAASTPGFKFFAELSREYIKCSLSDMQGEATVFGKVQRILPKGQKLEVFSVVPDVSSMQNLNREQRRKLQSNKKKANRSNLVETITGPAIVLIPVAVYR
jgi:hypothetical protein